MTAVPGSPIEFQSSRSSGQAPGITISRRILLINIVCRRRWQKQFFYLLRPPPPRSLPYRAELLFLWQRNYFSRLNWNVHVSFTADSPPGIICCQLVFPTRLYTHSACSRAIPQICFISPELSFVWGVNYGERNTAKTFGKASCRLHNYFKGSFACVKNKLRIICRFTRC